MSLRSLFQNHRSNQQSVQLANLSDMRRREALSAYLFIAPTFLVFVVFLLGPMIFSFGLSFFSWDVITPARFVGFHNYITLLEDPRFLQSLKNTCVFVFIVVVCNLLVAVGLAAVLQCFVPPFLQRWYCSTYMLPVIIPISSIAIVFGFLLHNDLGVVNYYLNMLSVSKIPWLTSSNWSLISIALVTVWKSFGFDLILFMAAIQRFPRQLYDAAAIDGANKWQQFRLITLPLLSPTIFFAVVVGLIMNFQVFDQPYVMTRGGPGDSTRTLVMLVYEDAFGAMRMGYGSTIALMLFSILLVLTVVQLRFVQRWVHYG
ncbi:MAG: sugar ABC transporter permease [Chloroflexota bacterium]